MKLFLIFMKMMEKPKILRKMNSLLQKSHAQKQSTGLMLKLESRVVSLTGI